MKKFYPYTLVILLPVILLLMSYSTGSPGGKTGSPGDGFNNCTDCHIGNPTINQDGWITTNIPAGGYMGGEDYTITVTGTHENVQKFGFELTAEDLFADKAGTFSVLGPRTQLTNLESAVTHTAQGNVPTGDSNSWDVNWTAPKEGSGEITFYAALNAANGNGTTTGDQIYLTTLTVTEFSVGVDETDLAEGIKMFPNPAVDNIRLQIPENSEIRIFDLGGREVATYRALSETMAIDVSGLVKGLYLVNVIHGEDRTALKLMKN